MVATLLDSELQRLDRLTRQELLADICFRQELLPADLLECLAEKSTGQLQILMLVARLIEVLRRMQAAVADPGPCVHQVLEAK